MEWKTLNKPKGEVFEWFELEDGLGIEIEREEKHLFGFLDGRSEMNKSSNDNGIAIRWVDDLQ
jgi:hypothetical protein